MPSRSATSCSSCAARELLRELASTARARRRCVAARCARRDRARARRRAARRGRRRGSRPVAPGPLEERTERGRPLCSCLFEGLRRHARGRPLLGLRGGRPFGELGPRRGEVIFGSGWLETGADEAVTLLAQFGPQCIELRVGLGPPGRGGGLGRARGSPLAYACGLVRGKRCVDVLERGRKRGRVREGVGEGLLGGQLFLELFAGGGRVGVDPSRGVDGLTCAGGDAARFFDLTLDLRERGRPLLLGYLGDGLPAYRARLARDQVVGERVRGVRVADLGRPLLEIREMRFGACREIGDMRRVGRGGGFGRARAFASAGPSARTASWASRARAAPCGRGATSTSTSSAASARCAVATASVARGPRPTHRPALR